MATAAAAAQLWRTCSTHIRMIQLWLLSDCQLSDACLYVVDSFNYFEMTKPLSRVSPALNVQLLTCWWSSFAKWGSCKQDFFSFPNAFSKGFNTCWAMPTLTAKKLFRFLCRVSSGLNAGYCHVDAAALTALDQIHGATRWGCGRGSAGISGARCHLSKVIPPRAAGGICSKSAAFRAHLHKGLTRVHEVPRGGEVLLWGGGGEAKGWELLWVGVEEGSKIMRTV